MVSIQTKKPTRSIVAQRHNYTAYRSEIRADFNGACGYCDDMDERVDGILFHVDHFAPQKRFPQLKTVYSNLVYACRFCNVCKSHHWIGDDPTVANDGQTGFVDPCSADYDDHLERDGSGRIAPKSELGRYIIGRLKLNLLRHELLWNARRARALRAEADDLIVHYEAAGRKDSKDMLELLQKFRELTITIEAYELGAVNG